MLLFLLAAQSVSCARLAPSVKSIEKNHLPANPRRGDFCIFFVLFCKKVRKKLLGYGFIVSRLIFLLLLKTIIEQSGTPVHTKLTGGGEPLPYN